MKTFLMKVLVFLLLVFAVDQAFGYFMSFCYSHSKGGVTRWTFDVLNRSESDVYIFGSSRASHHYVSSQISDSLNMECVNCGLDGNGIIYGYAMLRTILERHTPQLIILDVTSSFDIAKGDNSKYLAWLRPKANIEIVDSVIYSVDWTERYKMKCHSYKWNSKFYPFIKDFIKKIELKWDNGYSPIDGVVDYAPKDSREKEIIVDTLKLSYLKKFIHDAKQKTRLMFFVSPSYGAVDSNAYRIVQDLCESYNVPFFNFYCDSTIVFDQKLFVDAIHLNHEGATVYTEKVIRKIAENYNLQ